MQGRGPQSVSPPAAGGTTSCPTCAGVARARAENKTFPFCSPKCKLADLERWLSGAYRVPGDPVAPPEDGA